MLFVMVAHSYTNLNNKKHNEEQQIFTTATQRHRQEQEKQDRQDRLRRQDKDTRYANLGAMGKGILDFFQNSL
jgi:hypothetical protein